MQQRFSRVFSGSLGAPLIVSLLAAVGALSGACSGPLHVTSGFSPHSPPTAGVAAALAVRHDRPPELVQNVAPKGDPRLRWTRLDVVLTVLHVQVPRTRRTQMEPVWNHLREDVLDNATALRLQSNGVRVGVGREDWWDAVRTTIDAVEGVRTQALDPLRVPANYPLALELDERPREQTLFFVADDGVLSGETWPHSRNVLRVTYELNLAERDHVRLTIVPEVRQRLEGFKWVRSETGVTQMPNYDGRAFAAAAFAVDLEPGEFLTVAPGPRANLFGLVGGALLVRELDGQCYDSYVFLRADVNHVARGN
jgi:hypothetical protein